MPKIPKDGYYYNLLERETMQWQADLMHKYGVYGMCFYHYYFKDGRKILEKPAENLLQWKDIDMPFCFSWANETWARSWSKMSSKNVWSLENDSNQESSDGILLEQGYGDEEDWASHFEYLLKFFKDDRYIKVGNKPLFLIYKSDEIFCLPEMVELWNKLARKNGFNGIYFISTNVESESCDARLNMEPQYSFRRSYPDRYRKLDDKVAAVIDYSEIVEKSIKIQRQVRNLKKKTYLSAFPGYDDTPRRHKAGIAVINSNPDVFKDYIREIIKQSVDLENEFVFINAWNEWGETMYLEPDEEWGYRFLEAIYEAQNESSEDNKKTHSMESDIELEKVEKTITQYRSYWKIFDKWMMLKERGVSTAEYFERKGVKRIAVYGLGMLGTHFLMDLEGSSITIEYGIDGKGEAIKKSFPVYTLQNDLPEVDMVVVSVTYDYVNIKQSLEEKGIKKIISLDTVIGSLIEN
ncbi:Glycosyltransferase WbsX [Pseudobutyrivibrio sp. ACV-2]|nr:Glycosyltransferase WbsX [Pseudobutyrivibrio sp. ACV-2]